MLIDTNKVYIAVFSQIHPKRFDILVETQGVHRIEKIFSIDGLSLLGLTLIARPNRIRPKEVFLLAGNEGNELGHAFLNAFLSIF